MVENAFVEIVDLRDYPAVVYGIDEEENNGFPETMIAFNEKLKEADGFIISSPEHNGSMPVALKNAFDWTSRMGGKILKEKPTVFLATSPGARGGASVLEHLLTIMPYRGAKIVGGHAMGSFNDKVIDGQLIEGEDKEIILTLINQLVAKLDE